MAAVPTPPRPKTWYGRLLRGVASLVLALWVVLEEWIWDSIAAGMAWLGRLPLVHWLEAQIARSPPFLALLLFAIPGLALLPFKLTGVWLIAHGQRILGLAVFVVAKVVGTALLARIFALTKPQLLTIGWFRWCYEGYSHWKARLFAYVRAMPSYQRAKAWASAIKAGVRQWWQRHFRHADETKVNPHE